MAQTIPQTVADFETSLSAQTLAGDTTFTLSSVEDADGNTIPSGLYAFTIDGDTQYKEYVLGTLSGTTVSGVINVDVRGGETAGIQNYHRRGALVSITDWAVLSSVSKTLRGEAELDSSSPLTYDAALVSPTGQQIPDVNYVLSVVNGGPVSNQQQIYTSQVAGENLTANDRVYFKASDQKWWKVDTDTASTYLGVEKGFAVSTVLADATLSIVVSGIMSGFSGLTPGSVYYGSTTAGAIATTSSNDIAGTAQSATSLIVNSALQVQVPVPTGVVFAYSSSSVPTGYLAADGSAVSRTTYAQLFSVIGTDYGSGDGSTTFNVPNPSGRVIVGAGTPTTVMTFVSRSSNTITVSGVSSIAFNENQTGTAVTYSAPSGAITGLTSGNTYYLIRVTSTTFQVASSLANAIAGTAISLSSDGTGTQTFTTAPSAITLAQHGGEQTHALTVAQIPSHTHNNNAILGSASGTDETSSTNDGSSTPAANRPTDGGTGGNTAHNNMPPFLALNYIIKY